MRIYTVHLRAGRPPELVREGFSLGAFLFGPFWLALHRAWIPAILALVAWVLIVRLTSPPVSTVLMWAQMALLGLCGRDLVRWSLARRGYALAHAIAATGEDAALLRLLDVDADLGARLLPPRRAAGARA